MILKTQTITVHFHTSATETCTDPQIYVFASDMSDYGYVKIGEKEVELTWDIELKIKAQITSLEKRIEEARAEAEYRVTEYRGMIQSLLALPSGA